ncbi:MAG: TetR/AcrR family transcriptional regulator [Alphaproteobacteria bacterium]|nr:MAG: TetR/AcrR family transcriptional regulator [Alphaproteobacteria bacterium]
MRQLVKSDTASPKVMLLEAAKEVLLAEGYAGLSTRAIAAAAETQMSQIRYHFGSKEGMLLALYEYMTEQLIQRQTRLFTDPEITLSKKWEIACDYLDDDIDSGYVRVLQELIAVGWSIPSIGEAVSSGLALWRKLHIDLAREFQKEYGSLGPFGPEDIAALVGPLFIGVEAYLLLNCEEPDLPLRQALRRIGDVIRHYEDQVRQP